MRKRPLGSVILASFARAVVSGICVTLALSAASPGRGGALPSPQEVRHHLMEGNKEQKRGLSERLGLSLPRGARWGNPEISCQEFTSVEIHRVVLESPGPQFVLLARSSDCEFQFLMVFQERHQGEWVHVATVPFLAIRWEPEILFLELIRSGESEVIIRNRPTDTGTGMLQRNVTILKLIDGRLRVILDEVERQVFAIPTTRNGESANTEQSQDSEFWLVESEPWETSIRQIVEKQLIRDHRTQIVRWRLFIWKPELQVFEPIGTDGNPREGKASTLKLGIPTPSR